MDPAQSPTKNQADKPQTDSSVTQPVTPPTSSSSPPSTTSASPSSNITDDSDIPWAAEHTQTPAQKPPGSNQPVASSTSSSSTQPTSSSTPPKFKYNPTTYSPYEPPKKTAPDKQPTSTTATPPPVSMSDTTPTVIKQSPNDTLSTPPKPASSDNTEKNEFKPVSDSSPVTSVPQASHDYPTTVNNPYSSGSGSSDNTGDGHPPDDPSNPDQPVTVKTKPDKKFPILIATFIIIMTVTAFSGSFFYFRFYGSAKEKQTKTPAITPPVKDDSQEENQTEGDVQSASSGAEYVNPFETDAYENPFSPEPSYQNPFSNANNDSSPSAPYQNPFNE